MIEWKHIVVKDKTKNQHPSEPVATVDRWEGRFAKMADAVTIQGPTKHNHRFRVMMLLRWKDALTHDARTLDDAKAWADQAAEEWLDRCGLKIA